MGVDIRFLLTERSTVDIALESADGREVTSLIVDRLMDPGPIALVWPIADSDLPCPLANCKYQLRIQARPTYSAREYLRVERVAPIRPH